MPTQTRQVTLEITVPHPPAPAQVIAAVREELDRLSQRWKGLLPKIKKSLARKKSSATNTMPM